MELGDDSQIGPASQAGVKPVQLSEDPRRASLPADRKRFVAHRHRLVRVVVDGMRLRLP